MKKESFNIFEKADVNYFIGKMYLPKKILRMNDKRGFMFHHKYKSNLKGTFDFTQEIHLFYVDGEETITMEFKNLKIPLLVKKDRFREISKTQCIERQKGKKIETFRKLERPGTIFNDKKTLITSKDGDLYFEMPIVSEKKKSENELLTVQLSVKLINQKEYLEVTTSSNTPVQLVNSSEIVFL